MKPLSPNSLCVKGIGSFVSAVRFGKFRSEAPKGLASESRVAAASVGERHNH